MMSETQLGCHFLLMNREARRNFGCGYFFGASLVHHDCLSGAFGVLPWMFLRRAIVWLSYGKEIQLIKLLTQKLRK